MSFKGEKKKIKWCSSQGFLPISYQNPSSSYDSYPMEHIIVFLALLHLQHKSSSTSFSYPNRHSHSHPNPSHLIPSHIQPTLAHLSSSPRSNTRPPDQYLYQLQIIILSVHFEEPQIKWTSWMPFTDSQYSHFKVKADFVVKDTHIR